MREFFRRLFKTEPEVANTKPSFMNNLGLKLDSPNRTNCVLQNNEEDSIHKTKVEFSYFKKLLRICIVPNIKVSEDGLWKYDYTNACTIYLNYNKAKVLYTEIERFLSCEDKTINIGVSSHNTIMLVEQNKTTNKICLVIRKFNDDMQMENSQSYEFKSSNYFAIRNFNESDASFNKSSENEYVYLEIENFVDQLKSFYQTMFDIQKNHDRNIFLDACKNGELSLIIALVRNSNLDAQDLSEGLMLSDVFAHQHISDYLISIGAIKQHVYGKSI